MIKLIQYVKNTLNQRSTWLLIGSGVGTAAMLPMPWSIVSVVVHTMAALVPDGPAMPERFMSRANDDR
jgi:hypothetical protein